MSTQNPARTTRRRLAVKLNADSRPLVYGTAILVAALAITSLIASFSGLLAVADWAHLHPRLRWTVPVMLDGAITVYTAAALIRRARGERTRLAWAGVIAGTILSAAANAVHVVLADQPADQPWIRAVGAGIAALAPVLAALAVHQLADLAVAGPDEEIAPSRRRPARAVAPALAPAPATSSTPTASTPASSLLPVASRPAPTLDATVPAAGRDTRSVPAAERAVLRQQAVEMAREGRSRTQISAALGVGRSTIVAWTAGVTAEPQEAVVV